MIDPTTRCPSRVILLTGVLVLLLIGAVPAVLALADCPSGCSCLLPADAGKYNYGYCGGKQQLCNYDSTQQAMYCYTNPPAATCPSGCECLSDAAAKATFGSYVKCSESTCGVEQTAVAVIPRYCVKKAPAVTITIQTLTLVPAPSCPTGCECMPEAQVQQQPNVYVRCSDTPCSQVVTGSAVIKNYCYQKTQTTVCPQGCTCMAEAKAAAVYGSYERCSDTLCSSAPNTAAAAGAAPAPEYCFRQKVTLTVCPASFDCMSEAAAKQNYGNYKKSSDTVCGYDQYTAAQVPKYCIAKVETPAATATPAATCPSGCSCMAIEDAKKMNYNYCSNVQTACGYDASQRQLFCFGPYTAPACTYDPKTNACTGSCSQGYSCGIAYSTKDDSGKVTTVCNCIPPAVSQCTYDKEKGCVGTCPNGGQCMKLGQTQSAASNAATTLCGCQNADCYFDYALDTCAGKCSVGTETCQINTIYRNAVTGKTEYAECHCKGMLGTVQSLITAQTVTTTPTVVNCVNDPATGQCSGSCPQGQMCGSTDCTIDNSGRKTCTNCRCIGGDCACDSVSGGCQGSCPEGQTCWMFGTTTDSLGKNICARCECRETCRPDASGNCIGSCPGGGPCTQIKTTDPATGQAKVSCACGPTGAVPAATPAPAPDIFSAIGNFFKSLFGIK